jgi:hypothetical protein
MAPNSGNVSPQATRKRGSRNIIRVGLNIIKRSPDQIYFSFSAHDLLSQLDYVRTSRNPCQFVYYTPVELPTLARYKMQQLATRKRLCSRHSREFRKNCRDKTFR